MSLLICKEYILICQYYAHEINLFAVPLIALVNHRIVKMYEYPQTKAKNKVELANTRLSFEEVQKTEQELS